MRREEMADRQGSPHARLDGRVVLVTGAGRGPPDGAPGPDARLGAARQAHPDGVDRRLPGRQLPHDAVLGVQGRRREPHAQRGAGAGSLSDHLQLRLPRRRGHGDVAPDRSRVGRARGVGARRGVAAPHRADPARAPRDAGRREPRGGVPRRPRLRLHDGPGPQRRRRPRHGELTAGPGRLAPMKISAFHLMPHRELPDDFEKRYHSVWVTPPWWELADARRVGQYYNWTLDELLYAARAGFDGVCTNEHHQNAYGFMPSPNLMGSVLAKLTNGTNVAIVQMGATLPTSNPPIRVAEEYAMLDCISGGRLVAGLPLGSAMDVSLCYGITPMEHRERYREAFALTLKAWQAREIFAWNGRYYQLAHVNLWPRPIQQPHPPVWAPGSVAAVTNPMRRRAEELKRFRYGDLVEPGYVIAGSPATVRDRLKEEVVEGLRVGNLMVLLQIGSMPHELTLENMELFACEVMPALRDTWNDEGWVNHWWPESLRGTKPTPAIAGRAAGGA